MSKQLCSVAFQTVFFFANIYFSRSSCGNVLESMAASAPSEVTEPARLQPADTHPADVLAASAGREGLRADDGAAPHEG